MKRQSKCACGIRHVPVTLLPCDALNSSGFIYDANKLSVLELNCPNITHT